jgi:DNA-binding NarL/FixJ family response regulator
MTAIRILIVDDHPVVRDGLRGIFAGDTEFDVVGEAADGAEALALVARHQVDVVLMDLRMPGIGGVEAITRLRADFPDVRVLVLTTYDGDRDVLPAIEAGATGYLLKDSPRADLLQGVTALSKRELEVLRLVAGGAGNREIARRLFISEATVKTHLLHLYAKLGVRERAAAVAVAYQRRLLN